MNKSSPHQDWLKERVILENYKKERPELVTLSSRPSEKEIFSRIGIKISLPSRVKGYIRFYSQDFIVEEISREGKISEIEFKEREVFPPEPPFNLSCDLVKVGISTFDALDYLSEVLQIKKGRICHAGLKDVNALTSQKINFLDLNPEILEKIKKIALSNLFLTNFDISKESLYPGKLFGNRFTIFIRTKEKADQKWLVEILEKIKKDGFLNFYQTQRFGTPRFLSHILGKLILQGKHRETVLYFFTGQGLQEIPLIKKKREKVKEIFGDWKKTKEIFSELPFTFRNELTLLSYLEKNPKDFTGALVFFKDQTRFWTYSYASHLFNQILSLEKKGLELPGKIPLLLSQDSRDQKVYEPFLEKDQVRNFTSNLKYFRFLKLTRRFTKTKVFPEKTLLKVLPEGVILSFILEKGIYATTFLMNLFEIQEGLPLPKWVESKEYDIKKLLGIGSLKAAEKIFGKIISSRLVLY